MSAAPATWILFILVPFMLLLALASFAFWIWMLVDCLRHESDAGHSRLIWVLVIVLTHFLGALIYFFVRRMARPSGGR